MKCEVHPFYPRRYCWGCKYKSRECALCADNLPTSIKFKISDQAKEKKQINICKKCYQKVIFLKEGLIINSYDRTFAIRLIKDKEGRKLIKLEEH
jgi:hypothetical protein